MKLKAPDLNKLESEMAHLPQLMNQMPSPIDDDLRASMEYANKIMEEMKKNKVN